MNGIRRIPLPLPHLDHSGLAATIAERSGTRVAALDRAADYGAHYVERAEADRRFSLALMRHHGVPGTVIDGTEDFWDFIRTRSDAHCADVRLAHGERVRAGGRTLRCSRGPATARRTRCSWTRRRERPSSATTSSPGSRRTPRSTPRPSLTAHVRAHGWSTSRACVARPRCRSGRPLTGHGDPVTDHAGLVQRRLAEHERRCKRIVRALDDRPATAFDIGRRLWSAETVAEQPLLVLWEVLGHLDLLLDAGAVLEDVADDGTQYGIASFALSRTTTANSER